MSCKGQYWGFCLLWFLSWGFMMVLGFLYVWRGLVFVAHSWPGLASFCLVFAFGLAHLEKKNMHEVEECWDVAVLSDGDWYQSRSHNFMYWEQGRNILQLRGVEALGTFSVCSITGSVKPNLALCLQRSQALVELPVFPALCLLFTLTHWGEVLLQLL